MLQAHATHHWTWLLLAERCQQRRGDASVSCQVNSVPVKKQVHARHPAAVEAAIAGLRYGSVCYNVSSIMGFCITRLSWGAYPGNPAEVLVVSCSLC